MAELTGCVVNLVGLKENSTLASDNIARFISETLGYPIVDRPELVGYYDIVIQVNGPTAFCKFRDEYADMVRNAKYFIFAQNDYTLAPPSQVSKVLREKGLALNNRKVRVPNRWTTIPHKMQNPHDVYINWNSLCYREEEGMLERTKVPGIMYYGAYRDKRVSYFLKYFRNAPYDVYVSCSKRAFNKFEGIDAGITWLEPFGDVILGASHYAATVYIEDTYSHDTYCSPASRFYECLAAGVAILFDRSAARTMAKAGYDVSPYIVESQGEVQEMLQRAEDIAFDQNLAWAKDFREELVEKVKHAIKLENLEPFKVQTTDEWLEDIL